MSWEFLQTRRANPDDEAGPTAPAGLRSIPGRNYGGVSSATRTVVISGTSYVVGDHIFVSPLILDLDHDGIPDVNGANWQPHAGIDLSGAVAAFDLDGDRYSDVAEWVSGADDGLLVAPEFPSKVVSTPTGPAWNGPVSGRDLLGVAGGYRDGFEKLLERFDADHDGIVRDAELTGLYVWRDADGDGVVDDGELHTLSEFGIDRLEAPAPGGCIGAFYGAGISGGDMWDWWPSMLTADKVTAGVEPYPQVPLITSPLSDHSYPGPPLIANVDRMIPVTALAGAGMDMESARLVAVSPGGEWIVLQDRATTAAERMAGRARRLWIFGAASFSGPSITSRVVPLPATDVLQFAFDFDADHALVAVDGGSRLLELRLSTGALAELSVPVAVPGRVRCSFFALHDAGHAQLSCRFLDVSGNAGSERLGVRSFAGDSPQFRTDSDLDAARAVASSTGTIFGELPRGDGRKYFVTQSSGGGGAGGLRSLVVVQSGTASTLDDHLSPLGLAASGSRVLYLREIAGSTDVEVRVRDAATSASFHLVDGAYSYPYLVAGGTRAVVAEVDWAGQGMRVWSMPVTTSATLREVLTCGIGAIRVADDGSILACLAPEGLYATTRVPAAVSEPDAEWAGRVTSWPNPFMRATRVHFALPKADRVRVQVFSPDGRRVASLLDARLGAGAHDLAWNGTDARGHALPAGVYLVRVESSTRRLEGKVALLR